MTPRAAIIGAGPSGFYTADQLLKAGFEVDLYDALPTPFGMAGVTDVVLLGRRGPAQAAFTNPELRELGELERADVIVDPAQLDGVEVGEDGDSTKRRNVEILRDNPSGRRAASHIAWSCGFCARPSRSSARGQTGR